MLKLFENEFFEILFLRLKKYGMWFFVNFVFAMLPFLIMFALNYTNEIMFSNFLSFNFGLLVSSLYVLIIAIDSKVEREERSTFLLIITFFWIAIIDIAYVMYPNIPKPSVSELFDKNLLLITIFIFIVSVIISLLLNRPSIERSISELRATKIMDESRDIEGLSEDYFRKLKMDGI